MEEVLGVMPRLDLCQDWISGMTFFANY